MEVIHPDPPMREEIARGFFPTFEGKWRRAEVTGRWAMVAFVAANVLGAFSHPVLASVVRAVLDEVVGPDVVRPLGP